MERANENERAAYQKAAPLDPGEEQLTPEQKYKAALQKIRSEEGKVCDNFELCDHRACQSSYAAWAIADEALND